MSFAASGITGLVSVKVLLRERLVLVTVLLANNSITSFSSAALRVESTLVSFTLLEIYF
jgi:hypothetical protein